MATSFEETRYRDLLQELAQDLTSDKARELVFLLRLHIKEREIRTDIKSDATKLLAELDKRSFIGVQDLTLLVELFDIIGCIDLRKRILEKLGHHHQVAEQKLNKFMRILWKFGQELNSDALEKAKFMLEWTRDKENIENVWHLFEKAFDRGYIEENDINSVVIFSERIRQKEKLQSIINEYKSNSFSPGLSSSRETETEDDSYGKQEAIAGKVIDTRNQEHSQELQDHDNSGVFQMSDIFPGHKEQLVYSPNCPRYGQIIIKTVEKMKSFMGEKIGKGGFGIIYEAKIYKNGKCMFAIKKIETKRDQRDLFQKSYDKEIHYGRILHPFINPIIARAESLEEGICFLMYPYMKNKDLRQNIDFVNQGNKLCPKESNERIWSRCIYQVVQAVHFLHKHLPSARGPIFHRDLTSRNILLDENFNVRISDFGIAVEAKSNATKATITNPLVPKGYHPLNMSTDKYNASYDVFSVGVVMLEILTGQEAKLQEDPYYLYKKYNCDGGDHYLNDDLIKRGKDNEAASWTCKEQRNKFAEIALQAVQEDEEQRKKVDLWQKIEDMHLMSYERYKDPNGHDLCVSCCVNPKTKLSTKGQECIGNERISLCQHFCVHCLMNHHFNPLVCPQHGKTRPPFGDHVYAVLVAGNDVWPSNVQQCSAQIFVRDVERVSKVLTAKHPFVLGARMEHLRVVKPENPGTEDKMETKLKQAFEELSASIEQAIKNEKVDPKKDRLPNSLFIFYFSGHCSKDKGLYLGSINETMKASETWIQEMLNKELGVDQILVVLDCCHANSQNFTKSHMVNAGDSRKKASIVQLSSCDEDEKSIATSEGKDSYFTHFFCKGLLGLDIKLLENNTVLLCDKCEEQRKDPNVADNKVPCRMYHILCMNDSVVTFRTLKYYIEKHFEQLGHIKSSPEFMEQVVNAQDEKEIYLAYYNPFKWNIPIHLRGSKESHYFFLNSNTDSMVELRQNIIKYSIETRLFSDVLEFCESYKSTGKDSSCLIAIHPRYDKASELTSMESIYNARSCSHELEARIRENIEAISNGPVKWGKINSTLVIKSGLEIDDEHLKICENYIQVMIQSIKNVEHDLRNLESSLQEDLKHQIQEILKLLRCICTYNSGSLLEKEKDNVLRIYLYKEFSILALEPFETGNS